MKPLAYLFTMLVFSQPVVSQEGIQGELAVVPFVDPGKYSGLWYEIARLPNKFQDDCIGDVTATYAIDGEDFIVVNRCRKKNGEITKAEGRARRSDKDEPNTKLKVRFAPAFLSFLPFVWGNYWIIDLDADYRYAVIGEPDREYLWILARTKTLDDVTLTGIMDRIKQQGYDTKDIIFTEHTTAPSP